MDAIKDMETAAEVETVTADDERAAEDAAQTAESAVADLEQRVVEGDETITPEQIEQQRGASRFARLRAKAVARKAERSRRAERFRACDALRAEIEAHSTETGAQLAKHLRDAEKALTKFYAAVNDRNAQVADWHRRAKNLGLPRHTSPFPPPEEDARLGVNERQVIAGHRRLDRTPFDADSSVSIMQTRARASVRGEVADDRLYEGLCNVDAHTVEVPKDRLFYVTESGALKVYDHEPPEHVLRTLTPISRTEAESYRGPS